MKRRVVSVAILVLLLDLVMLGAAWRMAPALSLTAALAAPHVEPMLAPLYSEPQREHFAIDVAGASQHADLYRPPHASRSVLLVRDTERSDDHVAALARVLARRGLLVVVPATPPIGAVALDAYSSTLGRPLDVATVSAFDHDGAASPLTRAAYAYRLLRLAWGLTN